MNLIKKFKKVLSLVLLIAILIPAMPSYAATFKDVPSNHWAYEYIEKMSRIGYIKGDPGGTFRPGDNLTYLEVLSFVSRIIKVSEAEKQSAIQKYKTITTLYDVPAWAQEAVSICLDKGVISEDELKYASSMNAIKTGTKVRVSRINTSVYLAKAMGLDKITVTSQIGQLYKDLKPEHDKYKPLLFLLIDAKVLSPEGMGNYEFKPNDPVKREQMAKMLSTAYDYLQEKPQTPDPTKETETYKGTVYKIMNYGNNSYFVTVRDRNSKDTAFLVDTKTNITLDGKAASFTSIYEGQDIEVTALKGGNTALTIKVSSVEEKLTGYIKSIYSATNRIVIEYEDSKSTKTAELSVDKDADIVLNGKDASLLDLKVKDKVTVMSKNNIISEIEATSVTREFEGVITEIVKDNKSKDEKYFLTIEDSKGYEYEFEVDKDAKIYRNGKRARIEDLRVQDEVELELEYDIIIDIDAEVVEKDISGQIIKIIDELNQRTKITILNRKTNKEETYTLAKDARITIDKSKSTSIDLRIGFYVEATIGSDEIIEINANSIASQSLVRGKIKYLSTKKGEMDLEVYNSDISSLYYGDTIYIQASKDVEVRYGKSTYYDLTYLEKGDIVDIYGYYDGYTFIASEINIR